MAYIEIKNISKKFDTKTVLDNVSFEVKKGDIFGLLGPNGAGKSTLLNIMIGLLKADHGNIVIDNMTMEEQPGKIKAKLGVVPQDLALIEELNAIDNLMFFGSFYGLSTSVLKERVDESLKIIGLEDSAKKKVKTYSGGMKRRLNIAVALLHQPEIVIMDEPTVGVDPQSRNYIFDFIKKLNKEQNITFIYTSHYMEEIELLCNRLFIMDDGKQVSYGTKEEIKEIVSNKHQIHLTLNEITKEFTEALQQNKNIIAVEEIDNSLSITTKIEFEIDVLIKLVTKFDLKIKNLSVVDPTLEEVFLTLTGKKLRD